MACAKPLPKREGGRCLRRAPSRASETASAAPLSPFSFLLINSPASLISPDEMRPRERCPPAPPFGALIILPAGGGGVGDVRAEARALSHTHCPAVCAHSQVGARTHTHTSPRMAKPRQVLGRDPARAADTGLGAQDAASAPASGQRLRGICPVSLRRTCHLHEVPSLRGKGELLSPKPH